MRAMTTAPTHGVFILLPYFSLLVALFVLPQTVLGATRWPSTDHSLLPFLLSSEFSPGGLLGAVPANATANINVLEDGVPCQNGGVSFNGGCNCSDPTNYDGLGCQICQRNAACQGEFTECNRSLIIRGAKKEFQCAINSPLVAIMGNFRDIKAYINLDCDTEDGNAFSNGSSGLCAVTVYRVEPNNEFTDAFFHCAASECSMEITTVDDASKPKGLAHVYNVIKLIGQIIIISLCALLALLRCISSKLGRKRVGRIVIGLSSSLLLMTLIFVAVMLFSMRAESSERIVTYSCKHTDCHCAGDPPKKYPPSCSGSVLNNTILPFIKNSIKFTCALASNRCKLTLTDIALVFDLECNGGECVDTEKFPDKGNGNSVPVALAQKRLLVILSVAVVILVASVGAHAAWVSTRSRKHASEFVRLFSLSEPVSQLGIIGNDSEEINPADTEVSLLRNSTDEEAATSKIEVRGRERRDETIEGINEREEATGGVVKVGEGEGEGENEEEVGLVSRSSSSRSVARRVFSATQRELDRVAFVRRLTKSPFELTLTDLRYALMGSPFATHEEAQTRVILHQINFTVRSGEVLAIMGPSGAGKTTLLDLLSARSKQGRTTGTMCLNGTPVAASAPRSLRKYRNIIGYVSQEDTLLPALTVRQTIEYAARLKLPQAFSNTTIQNIVQRMIEALKLQCCEHTIIGDGSGLRGVSGGEKRRVSIAVELLANPRILFLDEPTSGLDAVSAKRVIEAVVELAKDSPMRTYAPHYFAFRPIVIFSIHQPSQEIFELFDKLLLLSRGVSVYCGAAHSAAQLLETRIQRIVGGVRPVPHLVDHSNHAEYLMKLEEILDDNARAELQNDDLRAAEMSLNSHPNWLIGDGGVSLNGGAASEGGVSGGEDGEDALVAGTDILRAAASFRVYYANVYQQTSLLTSRAASCLLSSFHLIVCHAAVTACVATLMMVLYSEQGLDLPGAMNRAGSITFMLLVVSFVSLSCLEQLVAERKLYVVERENGFYRSLPYLFSKVVVDILPLRVVPALVLSALIYFPMGLRIDGGMHFIWFIIIVVLFSVQMTLLVLCVGIITGSFGAAALLSSIIILWNFVFGGLLVQKETVPSGLRPFQSISPFFLAFEALLVNELDGQDCTFSPTDETGRQSSTSIAIMCVQYLTNIGLRPIRFNNDVALLAAYIVILLAFLWLLLSKFVSIVR